jgi:hypothetical protein
VADHVDGRPAVHHLQTDSIKLVETPLYLYIWILTVEFTHTTLFLYFSTCEGFSLVVEQRRGPVGSRELSRVFAQASEVVSEIGELLHPYLSL